MEQNVFEAGQQNFNLPHDIVSLPSGGIFYKSKKKSIKVGYLTASDENYLIGSSQSGRENIIMTLLRNKVYEHDLRPEELVEGDVEAILIYLRNTSFGPEYGMRLIDPKTNKIFIRTQKQFGDLEQRSLTLDEFNSFLYNFELFERKYLKSRKNV